MAKSLFENNIWNTEKGMYVSITFDDPSVEGVFNLKNANISYIELNFFEIIINESYWTSQPHRHNVFRLSLASVINKGNQMFFKQMQ